jgi:hypothetical protein
VPITELTLTGGERLRIEGEPPDIEAAILSASRGSLMEFAWLTEADSGQRIGINPDRVVMLRHVGAGPGHEQGVDATAD